MVVENVYIFPGIPELLRKKFESVRERFRGVPFVLKRVYVKRRESDIAADLNALLARVSGADARLVSAHPAKSRSTCCSRSSRATPATSQRALDALLVRLPADAVHKVE